MGDQIDSHSVSASRPSAVFLAADQPPSLPITAATRLQLELLRNDPVIDLKSVTAIILADPGATLQILRSIGEEFPHNEDRPRRIEDCIVSLGLARCYQAICASQTSHVGPHIAEWQYCRQLAECARELARTIEGFLPEEAYMVGLLHRLGGFPKLLGWETGAFSAAESKVLGLLLAHHWNLPECVLLAIKEQQELDSSSKWCNIMTLADQLVERRAA